MKHYAPCGLYTRLRSLLPLPAGYALFDISYRRYNTLYNAAYRTYLYIGFNHLHSASVFISFTFLERGVALEGFDPTSNLYYYTRRGCCYFLLFSGLARGGEGHLFFTSSWIPHFAVMHTFLFFAIGYELGEIVEVI